MMKKIKITSLMIAVTLILAGCGGGGDSGNTQSTSIPDLTAQEKVNATYYIVDEDFDFSDLTYVNNVIPDANFSNRLSADDFLLTENRLYNNTVVATDTKAISSTLLYFSEVLGSGNFVKLKKNNLNGDDIYNRFFPGFSDYFKKNGTKLYEGTKVAALYSTPSMLFPAGSECYQVDKVNHLKPYITFSRSNITDVKYNQMLIDFEADLSANVTSAKYTLRKITGSYNGQAWTLFRVFDAYGLIYEQLIVNYQDNAVFAEMNDFEPFDRVELLNSLKARIADAKSEFYNSDNLKLTMHQLESACNYYNPSAFNALRNFGNQLN